MKLKVEKVIEIKQPQLSIEQMKNRGLELSDNGTNAENIIFDLDIEMAINKLKPREKDIVLMISEGYNWEKVCKELKVGRQKISKTLKKLRKYLTNWN